MNNSPCILIVEDETILMAIYRKKFIQEEFRVFTASNGAEALVIAETEQPDIILMDMKMPVMDGLTAVKKLKENPKTQNLKVVFLTAFSDSTVVDVNGNIKIENAAIGVIKKGIGLDELVAEVRQYIIAS